MLREHCNLFIFIKNYVARKKKQGIKIIDKINFLGSRTLTIVSGLFILFQLV